jgi:long-chain acyl-CoA synthetase
MNLAGLIARHALSQPARIAVQRGGEVVSYDALDLRVRRLARRLRAEGAGPGDFVAIHMRDTPAHLVALLAIARIGAVSIPMDWRAPPPEIGRVVERFTPKLVVIDDAKAAPSGVGPVPAADLESTEPDDARPAGLENAPLVYGLTSGTTGVPKGIVSTHEEVFGRFVAFTVGRIIDRDDRYLMPLPLVFDAGRMVSLSLLILGAEIRLFGSLFDPPELVDAVNMAAATAVIATPKMTRGLLGLASGSAHLMPNLRMYVSTAGKIQPEERRAIRDGISPHLIDYYGSTGAGPVAIIANEEDGSSPTVVGRPMAGVEVEIVGEDGSVLANGEAGRIRIRGPGVTHSVAGVSGPTGDEGIRDGWYFPGDFGALDDGGLLHLHGRTAELIKRGGLMIHAQEVERVLSLHPAVVEAAVVGMPTESHDEEVVAFVVSRETVDPFDIVKFCRLHLVGHKVPQRIEFLEALPRNTNGKVVKAQLRER